MLPRSIRSNHNTLPLTCFGACALLVVAVSLPLDAAAPKARTNHASATRPADATTAEPSAPADEAEATAKTEDSADLPTIDVLKGLQSRQLSAKAEGIGDGRMTLSLTNRTNKKLRVVLPPGLVASGTTGQFGGMGGMMGGMGGMGGGMGMMGGGMGGMMGGGMGMMGGGMGMRGGGMGMRGGMMGGMRGGMRGGTLPASMGMMMLGRLIMQLIGDRDSWDQRSLMMGMMMGMRGGGMGMMGGGMGMMGGGMMGGGFRSVPPTSAPETTLAPHQTRHLPTPVVSLNGPGADNRPVFPAEGEPLTIRAIDQVTDDARASTALKRLFDLKAPQTVSQMVLWYTVAGADWEDVGRLSQGWGNAHEIALAQHFVKTLDKAAAERTPADPGVIFWDVETEGTTEHARALADGLRTLWRKYAMLGLTAQEKIPDRPHRPALACRVTVGDGSVTAKLSNSHPSGSDWIGIEEFRIKAGADATKAPSQTADREREAATVADAVAEKLVGRLVLVKLSRGPRVKGRPSFKVKIVNNSPMILNGLALGGPATSATNPPSVLAGMCVPPLKSLTLPVSEEVVARLNLKDDTRVLAADLSGL